MLVFSDFVAKIEKKRQTSPFFGFQVINDFYLVLNNDKIFQSYLYTLYFCAVKKRIYRMSIARTLYSVFALLFFASCASEYRIHGNSSVSRLDGKMLFVKVPQGSEMISVDSAEVVHGLFRMEGEIDSAVIASLYMDEQSILPLVVEKGNIQIQIDNGRLIVSGTPLNDKLYDFVSKKNSLDDRAYEVERLESRMIMDGKSIDEVETEITKEREKLAKEMDELVKSFIQTNYENVLGPGVFIMLCNGFPYPLMTPLLEEIVDNAPETFKNHGLIKEYVEAARSNLERLNAER